MGAQVDDLQARFQKLVEDFNTLRDDVYGAKGNQTVPTPVKTSTQSTLTTTVATRSKKRAGTSTGGTVHVKSEPEVRVKSVVEVNTDLFKSFLGA